MTSSRSIPGFTWAARWLIALIVALGGQAGAGADESPDPRLERLLGRLDKVARLYKDTALRFSCRERITYHPGTPYLRVYDLEYMYVFEEQGDLRDYRTELPTRRNKDKPPRPVALSDLELPTVVLRAYSAVFVFQRSMRDGYRYAILRDEKAMGRDAAVIRFDAIAPFKRDYNDWFGSAWVDLETSQLLKVEAMKADQHEEYLRLQSDLAGQSSGSDTTPHVIDTIITEFSVEHNGMRFPSRVVTRRSRFEVTARKGVRAAKEHQVFRVVQEYDNYRFYGVRAYEQIRDFVSGAGSQGDRP